MRSVTNTGLMLFLATFIVSGCRIDVIAPEGATVRSESGAFDCVGPATCTIEVNDLFFDETFSVETNSGAIFAGWKRRDRGISGGQSEPCRLFTSGFEGNDILLGFLESDETFFLEAELASAAALLPVSQDASIFADEPTSSISDGRVFVGRTRNRSVRRGLVQFDMSDIPRGSIINSVELTMRISENQQSNVAIDLHRLQASWGEGNQRGNGRGRPGPATESDATWRHRFFATEFWTNEGGDFVANASATARTGSTITWSSARMQADVQSWLNNPESNFGWILIGDEETPQSVQALFSKEAGETQRPVLSVVYTEPSED